MSPFLAAIIKNALKPTSMITIGNTVVGGTVIRNLVMDSNGTRYTDANGKQVVLPPGHGPISMGGVSIGGISIGSNDSDSSSSSSSSSSSDSESSDSDSDSEDDYKKKAKTPPKNRK